MAATDRTSRRGGPAKAPRPAARAASRAPVGRPPSSWTDPGRTWSLPAAAGVLFVTTYFLGYFDVLETRTALAGCIFLLLVTVLFFPLRYAERLNRTGRVLAALYAVAWLGITFYPVWERCTPADRIAVAEVGSANVPQTLLAAGKGSRVDLIIDGHLPASETGVTHAAQFMLTLEAEGTGPQTVTGDFKDRWSRQRSGRRGSVDVHDERTSTWAVIDNPLQRDLRVTMASVKGQAEDRLSLALYRHRLLPHWLSAGLAIFLLAGALLFDATTGASDTAASMVILTSAVLCGTMVFPYVGSPHPSFREMIGAGIVAALVGGPIGGVVTWLFRRRTEGAAGRRSRRRD